MTDYPYSGILKQAKNTDIIGRMSYPNQWPEDCRPITKRQYVLCLGTEFILKYINSQWQAGRFVVLTPDEGFESHSVLQYGMSVMPL